MSQHTSKHLSAWHKSVLTVLLTSLLAFLLMPLAERWELANIVMLFLLFVLMVAIQLGQTSGVVAAVYSVFLFDVLFVPPRFSLEVANPEHLVTFAVMLITAIVSAQMAARLKKSAEDAQLREARTNSLYQVARALAGTQSVSDAANISETFLLAQVGLKAYVIVTDEQVVHNQMVGAAQFHVETHLASLALTSKKTVSSSALRAFAFCGSGLCARAQCHLGTFALVHLVCALARFANSVDRVGGLGRFIGNPRACFAS